MRRERIKRVQGSNGLRKLLVVVIVIVGDQMLQRAVVPIENGVQTVAKRGGTPDDGIEDGWTSVGELLMTERISAVAVCRSSASLVSLNNRAFWMAMTAWSAKVCRSDSSLGLNGPVERATPIAPMPRPSRSMGANTIER